MNAQSHVEVGDRHRRTHTLAVMAFYGFHFVQRGCDHHLGLVKRDGKHRGHDTTPHPGGGEGIRSLAILFLAIKVLLSYLSLLPSGYFAAVESIPRGHLESYL